jgi:hypothetical protein
MNLSSLEEVFSQLVIREDTMRIAGNILEVMKLDPPARTELP